ncbi:Sec7 domain-containing protein [Toxoplasma gondii MAS]|uniref:Sec7 domain-containing protein n=1 Tax=Toxoplasma gondii MAS TaxID=943118 RepID=A0A086QZ74_TOXGO|nr:Sec7 domain-containing protein [Toxoplasma gondii MAS]
MTPSAVRLQGRRRSRRSPQYASCASPRSQARDSPPLPEKAPSTSPAPTAQGSRDFQGASSSPSDSSSGSSAHPAGQRQSGEREMVFRQAEEAGEASDSHVASSGESRSRALRDVAATKRCDTGGSFDDSMPEDACDSTPLSDPKDGGSLSERAEAPGQRRGGERPGRRRSTLARQARDGDKNEPKEIGDCGGFGSASGRDSDSQGESGKGVPRQTEPTGLPHPWRDGRDPGSGECDSVRLHRDKRREGSSNLRNRSDSGAVDGDKGGATSRPSVTSTLPDRRHMSASPALASLSAAFALASYVETVTPRRPPTFFPDRGVSTRGQTRQSRPSHPLSPRRPSASPLADLEFPSGRASPRRDSWCGAASSLNDEEAEVRGQALCPESRRWGESSASAQRRAESTPPALEKGRNAPGDLSNSPVRDLIESFPCLSIAVDRVSANSTSPCNNSGAAPGLVGLHADSSPEEALRCAHGASSRHPAGNRREHGENDEAGETRGTRDEWGEAGSRGSSGRTPQQDVGRTRSRRPSASEKPRPRDERARSREGSGYRSRRTSGDVRQTLSRHAAGVPPCPSGDVVARSRRRRGEKRGQGDCHSVCSTSSRLSSFSASPEDSGRGSVPPSRRSSRASVHHVCGRPREARRTSFRGDEERGWSSLSRHRSLLESSGPEGFSSDDEDSLFPYCAEGIEHAVFPTADPALLGALPSLFSPSKPGAEGFVSSYDVEEGPEQGRGCEGDGKQVGSFGEPLGWRLAPRSPAPSSVGSRFSGGRHEPERRRSGRELASHAGVLRPGASWRDPGPSPSAETRRWTAGAFPGVGKHSALHRFVLKRGRLAGRNEEDDGYFSHFAMTEKLRQEAQLRACLDKAVLLFNQHGLEPAVAVLEDQGILQKNDPEAVALFLYETPGLDKRKVGLLLGDASPFNISILRAFSSLFDVRGVSIDLAMRSIFSRFIPPGESQQLYRVLFVFAEVYVQQNPEQNMDAETAHFLAYAILLLHTDRHNRNVKRKITKDDWRRMTLGRDGATNGLDVKTLDAIYDRVVAEQFKLHMSDADKVYLRLSRDPRVLRYAAGRESSLFRASGPLESQHCRPKTGTSLDTSTQLPRRRNDTRMRSQTLSSRARSTGSRESPTRHESLAVESQEGRWRSPDPRASQVAPFSRSSPLLTDRRKASRSPRRASREPPLQSATPSGGQEAPGDPTCEGKDSRASEAAEGRRGEDQREAFWEQTAERLDAGPTFRRDMSSGKTGKEVEGHSLCDLRSSDACAVRAVDGCSGEGVEMPSERGQKARRGEGRFVWATTPRDEGNSALSPPHGQDHLGVQSSDSPSASPSTCQTSRPADPSSLPVTAGTVSASAQTQIPILSSNSSPSSSPSPGSPDVDAAEGASSKSPLEGTVRTSQSLPPSSPAPVVARDGVRAHAAHANPPAVPVSSSPPTATFSSRSVDICSTQSLGSAPAADLRVGSKSVEMMPQLSEGDRRVSRQAQVLPLERARSPFVSSGSTASRGSLTRMSSELHGAVGPPESLRVATSSGMTLGSQTSVMLRQRGSRVQPGGATYADQASVFTRGVSLRASSEMSRFSTGLGPSQSLPTFGSFSATPRSSSNVLSPSPYSSSFDALERGTVFLKLCRNGKMKPRLLSIDRERMLLCWQDPKRGESGQKRGRRGPRCLPLDELLDITLGCAPSRDAKTSELSEEMELRCFSLHFVTRSLDLLAPVEGALLCPFTSSSPPVSASRRRGLGGQAGWASASASLALWLQFFHAKVSEQQQLRELLLQQQHALAQSEEVAALRRKRREEEAAQKLELWRTLILPHWDKCWTCGAIPQAPAGDAPFSMPGAPSRIGSWRRFPSMLRGDSALPDHLGPSRFPSTSRTDFDQSVWGKRDKTLRSKVTWGTADSRPSDNPRTRDRLASSLAAWGATARLSTGPFIAAVRAWWGLSGPAAEAPAEAQEPAGAAGDGEWETSKQTGKGVACGGESFCVDGGGPPALFACETGSGGEKDEGSTLPPHSEDAPTRVLADLPDARGPSSQDSLWSHRDVVEGDRGRPTSGSPAHGASLGHKSFSLRYFVSSRRSERMQSRVSMRSHSGLRSSELHGFKPEERLGAAGAADKLGFENGRPSEEDGKSKLVLRSHKSFASFGGFAWLFAGNGSRAVGGASSTEEPRPGVRSYAESCSSNRSSAAFTGSASFPQGDGRPHACSDPSVQQFAGVDATLQKTARMQRESGSPTVGDGPEWTPRGLVGALSRFLTSGGKSRVETGSVSSGTEPRYSFSPGRATGDDPGEGGKRRSGKEEGRRSLGTQGISGNSVRSMTKMQTLPKSTTLSGFSSASLSWAPSQRDFRAWGEEPPRSRRFWRLWFPQFFGARFSLDRGRRLETAVSTILVNLWLQGLPGELRGTLWGLAIGNEQRVSEGLLSSLLFLALQRRHLVQKSQDARSRNRSCRSSASPADGLHPRCSRGSDRQKGPHGGRDKAAGMVRGDPVGRVDGSESRMRREEPEREEKTLAKGHSKAEAIQTPSTHPAVAHTLPPAAQIETTLGACGSESSRGEANRGEAGASCLKASTSLGLPYPCAGLWYLVDKKVGCGQELLISCTFEAPQNVQDEDEGGKASDRARDGGRERKARQATGEKRATGLQEDSSSMTEEAVAVSVCFRPSPSAETVARIRSVHTSVGCGEKKEAGPDPASGRGGGTACTEREGNVASAGLKAEAQSDSKNACTDPREGRAEKQKEGAATEGEAKQSEKKEIPHSEGDRREREEAGEPHTAHRDTQNHRRRCHGQLVHACHSSRLSTMASLGRSEANGDMTIGEGVRRLLQAYELYRPDIGAVRGMDGLASVLLCFMSLPAAFVAFVNLLPSFHLLDFYAPAVQASRRLLSVKFDFFEAMLRTRVPPLYRHFKGLRIHPNLYLLQWLETLFAIVLPFQTLCKTWDAILLLGEGFTFQVALGLLKYYEGELLANSFQGCMVILSRTARPDDDDTGAFNSQRFFQCVDLCPVDRQQYSQLLANQRAAEEKTDLLSASTRTT